MDDVRFYCETMRGLEGEKLREFARRFARRYPEKTLRILESIGSWPSSEQDLRALQDVAS